MNHVCSLKIRKMTLRVQSGLNISESVILTNSNNDADLVGTNVFQRYFNPL